MINIGVNEHPLRPLGSFGPAILKRRTPAQNEPLV